MGRLDDVRPWLHLLCCVWMANVADAATCTLLETAADAHGPDAASYNIHSNGSGAK